jgi:pumilio family protein 6
LTALLFHADAVQPLSDFFDLWASSKERKLLVRGFYPKEVQIFDGLKLKGKGVDVDGEVKGLEGALEDMGDESKGRERVLDAVEKTITDV